MENSTNALLQKLPSVDALLQLARLQGLLRQYGHNPVRDAARAELTRWRQALSRADASALKQFDDPGFVDLLCDHITAALQHRFASSLIPLFNLTGTVLHTNLGRALLPDSAIQAMTAVAAQPVTLEYDLHDARRGDRDVHVASLVCELTGAEAATVVNNNAAAVLLVLHSLAHGREVIISRGELVEIGGSFRIPDVMQAAGAVLREVGTTNRTHASDFIKAIKPDTALLMNVHTSNYAIHGFTSAVSIRELADIAHQHQLPLVADLGSGTLLDMRQFGLPAELTAREVLEQGADLVCFSADKLLGGPQAGIIAGKAELISRIKQNSLKRALRLDKIIIAALAEVLALYRDPQRLPQRLPTLRDLTRTVADINAMGEKLLPVVQKALAGVAEVSLGDCFSQIGSGAMPGDLLPSRALFIHPTDAAGEEAGLRKLTEHLRRLPVPVIGRVQDGRLILDLRCLYDVERFTEQLLSG